MIAAARRNSPRSSKRTCGRTGCPTFLPCALFAPPPESLPGVNVQLAELSSYDQLVGTMTISEEAAA